MDNHELLLTNRQLLDLNPLIAGEQACPPGHSFGPYVRRHTLIHYVLHGKGTLFARGQAFPVTAGQAFLILPNELTTYTADLQDPWHYRWIGFDGALSGRFAELPPVFSLPEDVFRRMFRDPADPALEYHLSAELLRLYARLFVRPSEKNSHVRRVETYIQSNYMRPVRVEEIASLLNLDRRYLSRLFKERTGRSIQEYLIEVRLEEAEQQLRQGRSVKEAAHLAGYEDVSNFSKIFKKHFGKSPADIRQG